MKRFGLIDDLRGIAATTVAVSHLVWLLPGPLPRLELGRLGVEVFFVISGFVIAYSLRSRSISPRFMGLFFVRRSVRLDAVYWAVIVVDIVVLLVLWDEPVPGWRDLLINAAYMQDLLGRPAIVSVAWTLCLELQFYMFFVAMLGGSQWMARRSHRWVRWRLSQVLWASLTAASVVIYTLANQGRTLPWLLDTGAVFINYWFMFFAGVLACWVFLGSVSTNVFWAFIGVVTAIYFGLGSSPLFPEGNLSAVAAMVVLIVVHLLGQTSIMEAGFGSKVVSYLGRISYSLYLTHVTIGVNFIYVVSEHYGTGAPVMLVAALAAFGLSVASAHLLYVAVEAPAIRLSKLVPLETTARTMRQAEASPEPHIARR